MYIVNTLAESRSGCNFQPPFSSAERNITEKDAPHIFTILGGPSPWQQFLRRNLVAHKKDLPARPIRIVTDGEFAGKYNGIFGQSPPTDAQGFVDRASATIYLREFPARNFNQTKAGLALHEAVHLFSHPPGRSNRLRATAYGLLETRFARRPDPDRYRRHSGGAVYSPPAVRLASLQGICPRGA